MQDATLDQAFALLKLLRDNNVTKQRLQDLQEGGYFTDLIAAPTLPPRNFYRKVLGLKPVYLKMKIVVDYDAQNVLPDGKVNLADFQPLREGKKELEAIVYYDSREAKRSVLFDIQYHCLHYRSWAAGPHELNALIEQHQDVLLPDYAVLAAGSLLKVGGECVVRYKDRKFECVEKDQKENWLKQFYVSVLWVRDPTEKE